VRSSINRILVFLALAGVFVASVLTYGHATKKSLGCTLTTGCDIIARTPLAKVAGIPTAVLGLLAYLALVGIAFMRISKPNPLRATLTTVGFIMSIVGVIFSAILMYNSFFVYEAKCQWCIASAVIMALTFLTYAAAKSQPESTDAEPAVTAKDLTFAGALSIICLGLTTYKVVQVAGNDHAGAVITEIKTESGGQATLEGLVGDIDGHARGPKDANIIIVEFADYSCPACRSAYPKLKKMLEEEPLKSHAKWVYRHFPLSENKGHELSDLMAYAAEYAQWHGKFWEISDYFFLNTSNEMIEGGDPTWVFTEMGKLGLNVDEFRGLLQKSDDKLNKAVYDDWGRATKVGLNTTPTLFVFTKGNKVKPTQIKGDGLADLMNRPEYQALLKG